MLTTQLSFNICLIRCTSLKPIALLQSPFRIPLMTACESTQISTFPKPLIYASSKPSKTPHNSATKALHSPMNFEKPPNHSLFSPLIKTPHPTLPSRRLDPSVLILTHLEVGGVQPMFTRVLCSLPGWPNCNHKQSSGSISTNPTALKHYYLDSPCFSTSKENDKSQTHNP
jgi:hypothetical protein